MKFQLITFIYLMDISLCLSLCECIKACLNDPAMRAVIGGKAMGRNAASSRTISGSEIEILTREEITAWIMLRS